MEVIQQYGMQKLSRERERITLAGKWQVVTISCEAVAPAGVKGGSHAGEKMTGYPLCAARVAKKRLLLSSP